METGGTVTRMIQQLRSNDPVERDSAAKLIWDRYFPALLRLARDHLDEKIRRREDEEDVLQSMYKSFCLRQQRGDYELARRDQLWSLLVQITVNKARNTAIRHHGLKRDVNRELATEGDPGRTLEQMDASEPTPAVAAVLNEALELRLQALSDPELRQIAMEKLEGWTNQEIAGRHGCSDRRVARKLELIRDRWMSME